MTPLVKIRLGNLFDGSSDLIVLPCSIGGTITDFVAKSLIQYKIPYPKSHYSLGDVDIRMFEDGANIAQYIAFAVSVDNMSTNPKALYSIGEKLGKFTQQESSVRAISVPLLGAGSGGLRSEVVIESLSKGFKSIAQSDSILTISILHKNVFQRLANSSSLDHKLSEVVQKERKTPRVFVSYSGISPHNKQWVIDLATFLRSNGIDARLDEWHLKLGMDFPQWMTNEIMIADKILIISDALYASRADGRLGGAGWETMIIQGSMLNMSPDSNRYLVIVRENDFQSGIPTYLRTKYCLHWSESVDNKNLQEKLLRELYDAKAIPPGLGEPPIWL